MLGPLLRMAGAGWTLIRHDALVPREMAAEVPAPVRIAASVLRIFAGPAARRGRPGERLAAALEHEGPAAIKLGQLLSTRADIFGEVFAGDLARLKDQLPPFSTARARAEIELSLGRPIASLFATFDPPVAAASLAQAHPATLLDGRKVAVKVLRPGIEARVRADIAALKLAAAFAETLGATARRLEPKAFAEAVARSMALELDLRLEAAAASEMGEIMARDSYMSAPAVVWDGVGKRVLTLEWAHGTPLSSPDALLLPGLDRPALATQVIRAFLAQALDHGLFHADLHEGNLFVQAPDRLVAVDFGIVGRLGRKERRFLAEILYGFIERDYLRIARVHFEAGYVPRTQNVEDFAQALRAVGEPIFGRKAQDVSMGRLLGQLFEITGLFDMHLRPELVLLQKTMVTVEGVARRIDPQSDIWDAARPVVERWIRRELSPIARGRELAERALTGLERLVERLEADPVPPPEPSTDALWFGIGLAVALAVVAFVVAVAR